MSIRLRFVTCNDPLSAAIRWAEDFWASHVEAVLPDGYLGAHADGGVQIRPVGYDRATMIREEFVDLPCDQATADRWEAWLRGKIGTPYDFAAILGIVVRAELGQRGHIICSALQTEAMVVNLPIPDFPLESAEISPRDLRLFLVGRS
jgi:hypothetical protein